MSRNQNVFVLPNFLSPQLCQFLGLPNDSSMSRSDVTRQIHRYANENSLIDGRNIHPDAALRALLQIEDNEQLTFFNFQRYFRHNYLGLDEVAALEVEVASMNTNEEDEDEDEDEEEEESSEEEQEREMNDDEKNRIARQAPSGLVQPRPISNELCRFLGLPNGSHVARTDVSRSIFDYVRYHRLQDSNIGRLIHPDATLRELLRVPEGDQLTYFNMQRYLGSHFLRF